MATAGGKTLSEGRGHWYLLTGLIIGAILGILVAWVIVPVQYSNIETFPSSLRADFKDEYRYMIAASYAVTGNLGRARARLGLLKDQDPIQALGDQSQRMLTNNIAPDVVRRITDLSQAIQQVPIPTTSLQERATSLSSLPSPTSVEESPTSDASAPTPTDEIFQTDTETPDQESTPTLEVATVSTAAPRLTYTPTPTPGPPFNRDEFKTFCEPSQPGLLQIFLKDSNDQPEAGVELVITWTGGEEHFFSGLKPELGNGYADFIMSPDVEYALSLSNGSTRVTGIIAPACTSEDGNSYPGGIRLEFKRP